MKMSRGGFSSGVLGSQLPEPDVQVLTSGGTLIAVHSSILAMASPVLDREMQRLQRSDRVIPILGVPCDAVSAFIRCLYTPPPTRCSDEEGPTLEKYGIHLLALSHVYAVQPLKQRCIKSLCNRLTVQNVIDVLQLARLCDAPDLRLRCLKLVSTKFKAVEKTEGWRFLHKHDPWLELDILQFIDEAESRRKRSKRHRQEQCVYLQLSQAMDSLSHIYTQGCTSVRPYDAEKKRNQPCSDYSSCHALQLLIKHFAACDRRRMVCSQCKRMLQLLRLHACLCESSSDHNKDPCRVPLCRQFKMKMQHEKRPDDAKWRLLAKKLLLARAAQSLSVAAKRKRETNNDQQQKQQLPMSDQDQDRDHFRIHRHRLRNLRLCRTEEASQIPLTLPPV